MVYLVLFAALAVAELASISLIFLLKDMLHSVLALSMVFFVNSLLFLVLGQPLLALLQLFVMIGGVSTFLFVGVASEGLSRFRRTSLATLAVLSAALFAMCFYRFYGMQFTEQQNTLPAIALSGYLTTGIGQLYFVTFALFGVALGAILVLRKVEMIR
jgi:NADH:ubiquinone oxidoreductase subunit 6 (subunit J)